MDNSNSFLLTDLPIPVGETFTIIVMRNYNSQQQKPHRKVYAHRFTVDNIALPSRNDLYDR